MTVASSRGDVPIFGFKLRNFLYFAVEKRFHPLEIKVGDRGEIKVGDHGLAKQLAPVCVLILISY